MSGEIRNHDLGFNLCLNSKLHVSPYKKPSRFSVVLISLDNTNTINY